jgi:DNA-binding response OmpR family regulator
MIGALDSAGRIIEGTMSSEKTILLIEDDREISSTISGVLDAAGYDVLVAPNGVEGRRIIETNKPDLIITDMMMPRMGGFPVLEFLKTLENPPKVIMITANEGGRHKAYAEMLGVNDYLRKPFAMDVLLESIERVLGSPEPGSKGANRLKRPAKKGTP